MDEATAMEEAEEAEEEAEEVETTTTITMKTTMFLLKFLTLTLVQIKKSPRQPMR